MILKMQIAMVVIGILSTLFYTPYLLAKGIFKMEYSVFYRKDKILSTIPIVNTWRAEKIYTGKIPIVSIFNLLCVLSLATKLIFIYTIPSLRAAQVFTTTLFLTMLVAAYIGNVIFVFIIIHDAGIVSLFMNILFAVFYPVGQWYIGTYLPIVISNYKKEKESFDADNL